MRGRSRLQLAAGMTTASKGCETYVVSVNQKAGPAAGVTRPLGKLVSDRAYPSLTNYEPIIVGT
jgi:hypothetical protein